MRDIASWTFVAGQCMILVGLSAGNEAIGLISQESLAKPHFLFHVIQPTDLSPSSAQTWDMDFIQVACWLPWQILASRFLGTSIHAGQAHLTSNGAAELSPAVFEER